MLKTMVIRRLCLSCFKFTHTPLTIHQVCSSDGQIRKRLINSESAACWPVAGGSGVQLLPSKASCTTTSDTKVVKPGRM